MGLIKCVVQHCFSRDMIVFPAKDGSGNPTDDEANITALADYFSTKKFLKVKKADLRSALLESVEDQVDADGLLNAAGAAESYSAKEADKLKDLLNKMIVELKSGKFAKAPAPKTPLLKFRPGERLRGRVPGTIGGFLINAKGVIFLFGDAHVLAENPWLDQNSNEVKVEGTVVGKVVYHNKIRDESSCRQVSAMNYDIALAELYESCYWSIDTEYSAPFSEEKGERSCFINKIDNNLHKGKPVYLYGAVSGVKKGVIKDTKPITAIAPNYPGPEGKETAVPLHDIVVIEKAPNTPYRSLAREGDSGGLWVSDDGAVGLQILGGVENPEAWVHPMRSVLIQFMKYDQTLRFLQQSDLAKHKNA
jgi:hypothetical protein